MELKTVKKGRYKYYYCITDDKQLVVFAYPLHRLCAFFIDQLLFIIIRILIGLVFDLPTYLSTHGTPIYLTSWFRFICYSIILRLLRDGKTIGKYLVGIHVVNKDFGKIKRYKAIWRALWYIPHLLLSYIPYIIMFFTKRNLAISDLVSTTYVIYEKKHIPKFIQQHAFNEKNEQIDQM